MIDIGVLSGLERDFFNIELNQIIHLTSPWNNDSVKPRIAIGDYNIHNNIPLTFQWDIIDEATGYDVIIDKYRDSDHPDGYDRINTRVHEYVATNSFIANLPQSDVDEHYEFTVNAYNKSQKIAYYMTTYTNGHGWDYRFKITNAQKRIVCDEESYYPLKEGKSWNYVVSLQNHLGGNSSIKVKTVNFQTVDINNKKVTPQQASFNGNIELSFIASDETGIYEYATQKQNDIKPTIKTQPDYYLRFPIEVGTSWNGNEKISPLWHKPIKLNTTVKVLSTSEQVFVPAGSFSHCLHIRTIGRTVSKVSVGQAKITLESHAWYAPQVGLVKMLRTESSNNLLIGFSKINVQLESFSGNKNTINPQNFKVDKLPCDSDEKPDINQIESLVSTEWAQSGYYQYFYKRGDIPCLVFPTSPENSYGQEFVVGCSAIAVGQLINYYFEQGYRKRWLEVMLKNVRVYPRFGIAGNLFYTDCIYPGLATKKSYPKSINDWQNNRANELREFLWAVSIGLDSHFSGKGDSTGVGAEFKYLRKSKSFEEKLKDLLIDRFRFNPNISYSHSLKRLDSAKNYIMKSINKKQPVLLEFKNEHLALIDAYRFNSKREFEIKINMGWGNAKGTNDKWYSGTGPIKVSEKGPVYDNFVIFINTTPINLK